MAAWIISRYFNLKSDTLLRSLGFFPSLSLCRSSNALFLSKFPARSDSLSFFHNHGLIAIEIAQVVHLSAWPVNLYGVRFSSSAQAESHDQLTLRQIAAAVQHLVLRVRSVFQADDGANAVAVGLVSNELDSQAMIGSADIAEEDHCPGVGGNEQVEVAVVIDICISRSAGHARRAELRPHLRRHLFKLSLPQVVKQVRRLAILDALLNLFNIVFNVAIGDKDIGPPVEVIIEKEAGKAQRKQAGLPNL